VALPLNLSLSNLRRHRSIINNFSRIPPKINSKMGPSQAVWFKASVLQVSSNLIKRRRPHYKKRSPSRLIQWARPLSASATFMPQQMTKETEIFTGLNLHNPWNRSSGLTMRARKTQSGAFNWTSSNLSSCKTPILTWTWWMPSKFRIGHLTRWLIKVLTMVGWECHHK
jgi:hypothetical protein